MKKFEKTIRQNLDKLPVGCVDLNYRPSVQEETSKEIYSSKHQTNNLTVEVFYKPISRILNANK